MKTSTLGVVAPVAMGDWTPETNYEILNIVRHQGSTYIASAPGQGFEPGSTWGGAYWKLIATDGKNGKDGKDGKDGNPLPLSDGTVTTTKIADNAVTTPKITDGAVTRDKLAPDAITNIPYAISGYYPTNNIIWETAELNENDKTCALTKYNGGVLSDGILNIPNEIHGYRVKKIQSTSASYSYNLNTHTLSRTIANIFPNTTVAASVEKIIINKGVELIGVSAFYNLPNLKEIVLPEGLLEIGHLAFGKTPFKSINFPRTLKKIGSQAFLRNGAQEVIDLYGLENSKIEEIGMGATQNLNGENHCTGGVELKLPHGLKVLENFAFNQCDTFRNETLHIPSTIERMGGQYNDPARNTPSHMFYNFAPKTFKRFTKSESCTGVYIDANGALYSADKTTLIAVPAKMEVTNGRYSIDSNCTTLGECCFSRNSTISTLVLPMNFQVSETQLATTLNGGNTLSVALYNQVTALQGITIASSAPYLNTDQSNLYNKDLTELWYIPFGVAREIIIRDGCTTLHRGILGSDDIDVSWIKLTSIYIPASVQTIESHTLATLNKIKSKVTIADSNPYWTKDASGNIVEKPQDEKIHINFSFDKSGYTNSLGTISDCGFAYKADNETVFQQTGNPSARIDAENKVSFYPLSFAPEPFEAIWSLVNHTSGGVDMSDKTASDPVVFNLTGYDPGDTVTIYLTMRNTESSKKILVKFFGGDSAQDFLIKQNNVVLYQNGSHNGWNGDSPQLGEVNLSYDYPVVIQPSSGATPNLEAEVEFNDGTASICQTMQTNLTVPLEKVPNISQITLWDNY